jgi:predicted KAP-like P-loop ATPase
MENRDIFDSDKLDRKKSIENLSKILLKKEEHFVFAINGAWGSGKTTFVKFWKDYLNKEHSVNSIYFSAWEDDFTNDPLISLLGEINSYIDSVIKEEDSSLGINSLLKDKANKVYDFASQIIKRALPAFAKGAIGGVLDYDKGFEDAIGAMTQEATKN